MFKKVLIFILLQFVLTACPQTDLRQEQTENGGIAVSTSSIQIDSDGNVSGTLVVTADCDWVATVPVKWLTLAPAVGEVGETVISVTCEANDKASTRTADVLIWSDTDSKTVSFVQEARPAEFSCSLSASSCAFDDAYSFEPFELLLTVGEDAVDIDLSGAEWVGTVGGIRHLPAGSVKSLGIIPKEPNYSSLRRTGTIRFVGSTSGKSVELQVSQAASYQDADESFDNIWLLNSSMASTSSWRNNAVMYANKCDAKGILSIVSSADSDVSIVADGDRGTFSGLLPGDAILLRTPVKSVAAGTDVFVMLNLAQKTSGVECEWIAEFWDKNKWNEIRTFKTCNESQDFNYATFIGDFILTEPIENDYVKVRFRLVSGGAKVVNFIAASPWYGAAMTVNAGEPEITDTRKVLVLGNSFTYYWASAFKLKQFARSQGYRLDIRTHSEPGQSLLDHARVYTLSKDIIKEGEYDNAILQEVSTTYARYADGSNTSALNEFMLLSGNVMAASPSCDIVLENTWAYSKSSYMGYGSYVAFDDNIADGCKAVATAAGVGISPIGQAFAIARETHPSMKLLHTDNHHPSEYGTYLKCCVNYLTLFGGDFNESAYDGGLPAEDAAVLRSVAKKAWDEYTIINPHKIKTQ